MGEGLNMALPRLLLIDDEPHSGRVRRQGRVTCAALTRSSPTRTRHFRDQFRQTARRSSCSTSACRAWTGSNCCASLPTRDFGRPC